VIRPPAAVGAAASGSTPAQEGDMKPWSWARVMEGLASRATAAAGSSGAFMLACGTIIGWGLTGPLAHYSDTWQLVINTSTTIVTFLMVFLIQRSQNKDAMAMQLKLNELIAAMQGASNHLINVEDHDEAELRVLRQHYARLADLVCQAGSITDAHSVEEADERARGKPALGARLPQPVRSGGPAATG
jgi:low affinity Fe/Cu permease